MLGRNPIRFAQSWEDYSVIEKGLDVKKDDAIVSILSSGDNALNLLRFEPAVLYGFDMNPAQVCEVKLKIAALQHLAYRDFLILLGYGGTAGERAHLFRNVMPFLDAPTVAFWNRHLAMIRRGFVFQGAFERYLSSLGRLGRFFLADEYPDYITAKTREERQRIFEAKINRPLLRGLTKMFMQNQVMNHVFFQNRALQHIPASFDYHDRFWKNLSHACVDIGCSKNPYLYWLFTGTMLEDCHDWQPYLQEEYFAILRQQATKIRLCEQDLNTGLKNLETDSIDCFYLSDIFEWMSHEETEKTISEIVRVAKQEAKIISFVLNFDKGIPQTMQPYLNLDEKTSLELHTRERAGFYSKVNRFTVTK